MHSFLERISIKVFYSGSLQKIKFLISFLQKETLLVTTVLLTIFQLGIQWNHPTPPPPPPCQSFSITQKLGKLVSWNFVIFLKFTLATFIQKIGKTSPRLAQRSKWVKGQHGVFQKLKSLDISLIIYHQKVFPSLISKKK